MLRFDYFHNFYNLFDDAIDAASTTRHEKFCPTLGKYNSDFFGFPYSLTNVKQNKNPHILNFKLILADHCTVMN